MRIVLKQVFPLARFHATPWRVNPFDEPHGEWPPSPWRLARAVVARWYQWARESPAGRPNDELDRLVQALCTSRYAFFLPPVARRGAPVRQYFPAEFAWDPGEKKKARMRTYKRSLAQDNYWCTAPGEEGAIWWFIEGDKWNEDMLEVLDQCLERMTYFGRAETFTRIERVMHGHPEPNCELLDKPRGGAVPVLVPLPDTTREDLERTSEDPMVARRSVPPRAAHRYAVRPPRPVVHEHARARAPRERLNLMQFAIGWNVAPDPRAIARLTSRFRGAVLKELLKIKSKGAHTAWRRAPRGLREQVALMAGKDADGQPLQGHQHAEFFVWYADNTPIRLLVWRGGQPFSPEEEEAMLAASTKELSWAAPGNDADAWKVRLVPLDRALPAPPGFDGTAHRVWESATPYVPPRHYLRRGRLRERESIENQVRRELSLRGLSDVDQVQITVAESRWVAVHLPRRQPSRRAFLGDRRAYRLRIEFPRPVAGPLRLGHSSSFGLGLFRPADSPEGVVKGSP